MIKKSCFPNRKEWIDEKLKKTGCQTKALNHTNSTQSFFKSEKLIRLPAVSEKDLKNLLASVQENESTTRLKKNFALMRLELFITEHDSDEAIRVVALPFDDEDNLAYFESSEQTILKTPRSAVEKLKAVGKEYYSHIKKTRVFGIFDAIPDGVCQENAKKYRNESNIKLFDSTRAESLNHSEPGVFQALNTWGPEIWSHILQRAHKEGNLFKKNTVYKIIGARIVIVSTRDMCRYCEVQMHHSDIKNNVSGFILRNLKLPNGARFTLHEKDARILQTQMTIIGLNHLTVGTGLELPTMKDGTLIDKLNDYEPYVHLARKGDNIPLDDTVPCLTHRTAFNLSFKPKDTYYKNNLKTEHLTKPLIKYTRSDLDDVKLQLDSKLESKEELNFTI